ncbi:MAG: hypothetical protein LBH40_00285 [Alphaproteobacteria bacterium]|jgi:hypothetical protein|nr:hypothetical protein [Alphaproteobacteria bacterium]
MRLLLTLLTAILFANPSFASSEKWESNSVDSMEASSIVTLKIFENGYGEKNIGIIFPSDECDSFKKIPMNAPSYYINNTKVQIMAQCLAKNVRMDFPKTDAGRDYLINELKTKDKVVYKQDDASITFSTKGFTNAYNSYESEGGGL